MNIFLNFQAGFFFKVHAVSKKYAILTLNYRGVKYGTAPRFRGVIDYAATIS
jgi:hypothetical protein